MATIKDRLARAAAGESALDFDPLANDEGRFAHVRLDDVEPDPSQPRKDLGDIDGLALSIKEHGLINPIVVYPIDNHRYRIVAGERRYTACRKAGLTTLPVLVRTVEEQEKLALQLIENLHRKDLNPLEEADGYRRLMDEFNLNQEQVASRVGKSRTSITETLSLLRLPGPIQEQCRTSDMASKSLLLEVLRQPSPERQEALWRKAKNGQITVKQAREAKTEDASKASAQGKPARETIKTSAAVVTVQFKKQRATRQDIVKALQEALKAAQEA